MDNLKPFEPQEIDTSLIRVVSFGGKRYALFPFVDATGSLPEFSSVCLPLQESDITASELAELAGIAQRRGADAAWFIQFNTPWLVGKAEADDAGRRSAAQKRNR